MRVDDLKKELDEMVQVLFRVEMEENVDMGKITGCYRRVREFLVMYELHRYELVEVLFQLRVFESMTKYINKKFKEFESLLIEISWILIITFGISEEELITSILKDTGLLGYMMYLIDSDNDDIFSNIIWAFANLIVEDEEMKDILFKQNICTKVFYRIKQIRDSSQEISFSHFQSFLIFYESFFINCINFDSDFFFAGLNLIIDIYINGSESLMMSIEEGVLSCLYHVTFIMTTDVTVRLLKESYFQLFIQRLFKKLKNINDDNNKVIFNILQNMTHISDNEICQLFTKSSTQKILLQHLQNKSTRLHTITLFANLCHGHNFIYSLFTNNHVVILEELMDVLNFVILMKFQDENFEAIIRLVDNLMKVSDFEKVVFWINSNEGKYLDDMTLIDRKV